jgi:RNA polymerase sigma-70 factor (ECF subfamily)
MKSDQDLMKGIRAGEESALSDLYGRHSRLVYSLVLRITGDTRRAEELTQDVFWQIWRQAAHYDAARGTPVAWMTMMARSRALDFLRSAEARRIKLVKPEAVESLDLSTESRGDEDLLLEERSRKVREALGNLPEVQRQALELAYFGGLSQSDIAERLQQPLGTIKTRIRQAMMKMREGLAAYLGADRL